MNGVSGTIAAAIALVCFSVASTSLSGAQEKPTAAPRTPTLLAVRKNLGPPPAGVVDLKFRDIFKTPVGDKGLEPSATLLALDGKRVRMVGYMVRQQPAPKGSFLFSPLPAEISDEDEPLADDLPPNVVAVEIAGAADKSISLLPGLIQITGKLHVGAKTDTASGRISSVQIVVDGATGKALLGANASSSVKSAARPGRSGSL